MKLRVQELMSQGMTDPSIIAANTMLSKKQVILAQRWLQTERAPVKAKRAKVTRVDWVTMPLINLGAE